MVQPYKKNLVSEIKVRLDSAKAIVLVDYKGINIEEVDQLRKRFRNNDVDYFVQKNTLVRIALNELGITELDSYLVGPTGVAVCKTDEVSAAREMATFIKDVMEEKAFPKFKAGLVDGVLYLEDDLSKLSKIPSRDVLLAKMFGSMLAPVSSFVRLIDAIAKKDEEAKAE
jgi:large subunit ribosomal protein L10